MTIYDRAISEVLRLAPTNRFFDRAGIGAFLLSNNVGVLDILLNHGDHCRADDVPHHAVRSLGRVSCDQSSEVQAVLWVTCDGLGNSGSPVYRGHTPELVGSEEPVAA